MGGTQELSRSGILLTGTSRAFGCPSKYIQGPGEFLNVFKYGSKFGNRFLFLIDSGVY